MRKTIPAKSLSFPMDQEELLSKIILMKKRQYQSSRRLWQQQAMTKNVSQIRIHETKINKFGIDTFRKTSYGSNPAI